MSLPTPPSGNKKGKSAGDKSQFSLPDLELPDLNDLEPLPDLSKKKSGEPRLPEELNDLPEQKNKNTQEDFEEIEKDFEDDRDLGDDDFEDLDDDFEDLEENFEDDEDFEDLNDGKEDDEEDLEENFSFLPTVDFDEEDNEDDEEDFGEDKGNSKKEKGFKELDEEAVKKFINNLKSKLSSLKKGNPKKSNNTSNKIKNKSSIKKLINGKNIIYLLIGAGIIGLLFFLFSSIGGNYVPLEELSYEASQDDIEVALDNFSQDDNIVTFDIYNQGDMSANFFMEAEFTEKTGTFSREKYSCRSDIISLETDGQAEESLRCENFDPQSSYKIDIEIIEIR